MISSISAGILAFLLTLIGIPAFIRFYRKAQITGQQMHEGLQPWEVLSSLSLQ